MLLSKKRYPVFLADSQYGSVAHLFFDSVDRRLFILNYLRVAVSEIRVLGLVDNAVREVLIKPKFKLLVSLNLLAELFDLRLIVENLAVLQRQARLSYKRVFEIQNKLDLVVDSVENLFFKLLFADTVRAAVVGQAVCRANIINILFLARWHRLFDHAAFAISAEKKSRENCRFGFVSRTPRIPL